MLRSILHDNEHPQDQQNGSTPKYSSPHAYNKQVEKLVITSTPCTPHDFCSRPRQQNRPPVLWVVAIVSVATLLIMVSLCKAWHHKKHLSGITRRMLSENSHDIDEYEQSIIEGCLEMEAELGFLQRGEVQQPDADEAGHVQRLVETLRTAASEHEAMQRIPPPWDWDPSSHAFPGQTPKRKEHTMHGFQSAVRLEDDGRRATVQPSSSFPGHGLLDATHALDPEAWLDEVPQIINDPDEYGGGNVLPSVVDESKGGQGGQLSTPHVTKDVPKRKNMQDSGSDIVNHPYVRLPVLARGVVIRPIKVENLLISYNSKLRLDCSLDQLRRLFALRELDQEAVNELVTATEGLVGAVSYHAKKSLRNNRPVYAAEATGYNFLAFDALVCAIQLLGDYMNLPLWWEGFVAIFNRDPFSKMEPLKRRTGGMYRTLIVRLLEALDIYKTGKRPSLEEVIAIKDILFCSPRAPKAFKDPKWDPWREDAKGFKK